MNHSKKLHLTLFLISIQFTLSARAEISFLNYRDGETLPYPLAVVKGRCKDDLKEISLELNGEMLRFPVRERRFNSIVMLKEGVNDLNYKLPGSEHTFRLTYKPTNNPRKLRVVYTYLKSSEGKYWNVVERKTGTKEEIKKKIELSLLMYQASLAELMKNAGYGRMTIEIMPTEDGGLVHELEIDKTAQELIDGGRPLRDSLFKAKYPYDEKIQDAYVAAYVRDAIDGAKGVPGQTAALRNRIHFITIRWGYNPSTLHELNWALVDDTFLGNDRLTSGTAGLWLHEAGHPLYGQHTLKEGIMNSGGRWLYNQFLLLNAYKHSDTGEITLVDSSDPIPVMQPATAFVHYMNPFVNASIAEKDILPRAQKGSGITLTEDDDNFIIESERGIRSVEFYEYSFSGNGKKTFVMSPYTIAYPEGITKPSANDVLQKKVTISKASVIENLYEMQDLRNVPRLRVLDGHFAHGRHWLERDEDLHDENLLKIEDAKRFTVKSTPE
tara:strand:- start:792 stop:2282 length:1491 start_codon:yes stop_codon:yes gene_type:complete